MADTTLTAEQLATSAGIETPEQFQQRMTAEAAAAYPKFSPSLDTANDPLAKAMLAALDTTGAQAKEKAAQTYEDLLTQYEDRMNARGRFFSGEATTGTQKLLQQKGEALQSIDTQTAAKREQVLTDRTNQLYEQQYKEFQATKEADITAKVAGQLATYLPQYAEKIKAQLADVTSPWLDIPLDSTSSSGTATTTTSTTTGGTREKQLAEREFRKTMGFIYVNDPKKIPALIKKYGKARIQSNSYGDVFVTPA